MGKPTGFMEYERKLPQDREPEVRMNFTLIVALKTFRHRVLDV